MRLALLALCLVSAGCATIFSAFSAPSLQMKLQPTSIQSVAMQYLVVGLQIPHQDHYIFACLEALNDTFYNRSCWALPRTTYVGTASMRFMREGRYIIRLTVYNEQHEPVTGTEQSFDVGVTTASLF